MLIGQTYLKPHRCAESCFAVDAKRDAAQDVNAKKLSSRALPCVIAMGNAKMVYYKIYTYLYKKLIVNILKIFSEFRACKRT